MLEYLQIIALFLFLGISYYMFKVALPNYFNKKAENLATKEDIGDITKIVGRIKTDLNIQTEQIKGQISLLNQHTINVKNVEREAIINYYRKLIAWFVYFETFSFVEYNNENYQSLKDCINELHKIQHEYDVAKYDLKLFAFDKEILELDYQIFLKLNDFKMPLMTPILKFIRLFKEANQSIANGEDKNQIMSKCDKEYFKIVTKFGEERLAWFKETDKLMNKMILIIIQKLKQI